MLNLFAMNIMYKCNSCQEIKIKFRTNRQASNGAWICFEDDKRIIGNTCYSCKLKRRSQYLKTTKNITTKRYEKTENGFLMRIYRNMKSRVSGVQKQKAHLYVGKYLLPKEEFYAWAKPNLKFKTLFKKYKKTGYDRKLAPTVDRIDSDKGYELSNMRWITHSENSRLGSISKHRKPCP